MTSFEKNSKSIAAVPWMPAAACVALRHALVEADTYLEYGSGGSTVLAAVCGCSHVFTVESDRKFLQRVRKSFMESRACRQSQLISIHVDIGKTKKLGHPVDESKKNEWPRYAMSVWDELYSRSESPDMILIDGRFRVACFSYSLARAKPGTSIFFDDYEKRKPYHIVETLLEPCAMHEGMAEFEVPSGLIEEKCLDLFDKFKYKPGY